MEFNKIYNEDCLQFMKKLPDNYVDLVITSPPYNAGCNVRGYFYNEYKDDLTEEEYYNFICKTIKQLIRVTKYYVFFNFQLLSGNKNAYLRIFSKENDIILDPFIGTGTTAYVSKMMNRNFIGCEINKEYVDIANKRLSQANLNKFEKINNNLTKYQNETMPNM